MLRSRSTAPRSLSCATGRSWRSGTTSTSPAGQRRWGCPLEMQEETSPQESTVSA